MMNRRNFAQLAALAGLSVTIPISTRNLRAAEDAYGGPYYVLVNAGGGWDPRFMFDPTTDITQNRLYTEIGKIGNISFAPLTVPAPALDPDAVAPEYSPADILLSPEQFLQRHGKRLTVFNGVDMETNNHDAGTRAIWSGQLQEGYPSFGAMIAAEKAGTQPMAYMSAGGFDDTVGLVPLTRVGSVDILRNISYPNRYNPGDPEDLGTYHSEETWSRIQNMQAERLVQLRNGATLPRIQRSMADLQLARNSTGDLKKLVLPEKLVSLEGYDLRTLERSMQQAQIAISAFSSGIAASVNLDIGGFDTHGNHDRDQPDKIFNLLALVDYVIKEVEAASLTDRVVILVGSDFARGPQYNGPDENDGKDHWPIGSFLALGAGIEGDRVIGGTTAEQLPIGIDEASLATTEGGTVINAKHIHHSLRRLAGLDTLTQAYPLPGTELRLFG